MSGIDKLKAIRMGNLGCWIEMISEALSMW
jgi:hypothetical protein